MSHRSRYATAAATALLLIGVVYHAAAQSSRTPGQALPSSLDAAPHRNNPLGAPANPYTTVLNPLVSQQHTNVDQLFQRRTAEAIKDYQEAENAEQRAAAEEKLRTVLAEHFDRLAQQREQELADLKARLEKLTAELENRRQAKGEIVELRLKVLINEAKGLGFYPNSGKSRSALDPGLATQRGYNAFRPARQAQPTPR